MTAPDSKLKVAFVHDWLVSYRGGEKVLESLLALYPDAPIYTLFYEPGKMPSSINERTIKTPFFLRPFKKFRKALLPLFPFIIEFINLRKFDLIISTSSCVAKSVPKKRGARHICYIHSPMRYIWDQEDIYLEPFRKIPLATSLIKFCNIFLRKWDVFTAGRVDRFICNSHFVADRVRKFYRRDSTVIHPPIEAEKLSKVAEEKSDYFITAGALVWYKRFDLAIDACKASHRKLVIAGNGPYERKLRDRAGGDCAFAIDTGNEEFQKLIAGAQALIFPGVEDFGMIAVEAMALGTPVIAFKAGGALDYIRPGETGIFFENQDVTSLESALREFSETHFSATKLQDFASNFNEKEFQISIRKEIDSLLESQID